MATITPATAGSRITAAFLNQFIPGAWAAITSFSSSWTNHGGGSTAFSVRLINAVTVHLMGALAPGTLTAGTQIGALPSSAYFPLTTQVVDASITGGTGTGTSFKVFVNPTGTITLEGAVTSGASNTYVNGQYALDI